MPEGVGAVMDARGGGQIMTAFSRGAAPSDREEARESGIPREGTSDGSVTLRILLLLGASQAGLTGFGERVEVSA
jgi:hypothetical protein